MLKWHLKEPGMCYSLLRSLLSFCLLDPQKCTKEHILPKDWLKIFLHFYIFPLCTLTLSQMVATMAGPSRSDIYIPVIVQQHQPLPQTGPDLASALVFQEPLSGCMCVDREQKYRFEECVRGKEVYVHLQLHSITKLQLYLLENLILPGMEPVMVTCVAREISSMADLILHLKIPTQS